MMQSGVEMESTVPEPHTVQATSRPEVTTISYLWKIGNFPGFTFQKAGTTLFGPIFGNNEMKWGIEVGTYGKDSSPLNPRICLTLLLMSSEESIQRIACTFSIVNDNGHILHNRDFTEHAYKIEKGTRLAFGFIDYKTLITKLEFYAPKGILKIFCAIDIIGNIVHFKRTARYPPLVIPDSQLALHISNMSAASPPDIVVRTRSREFKCHKTILAARSAVLAAGIVGQGMQCSIEANDVHGTIMLELLRYIYSDEVWCIGENALPLYHAAVRYRLDGLKAMCESQLLRDMDAENALYLLLLPDHSAQMNQQVLQFICRNIGFILTTKSWQEVAENNIGVKYRLLQFQLNNS